MAAGDDDGDGVIDASSIGRGAYVEICATDLMAPVPPLTLFGEEETTATVILDR
ncbi:MAG: hypothetical protein P8010_26705 [Desulfosarcinaceae bacterium]